mmetsp:Transcript_1252/g.1471  ORF Transcript_1252/g.1471 Transcript_1252/m.1471 type:complete len:90 (+) Transcript_1252:621-890(+)|eukprot:CAMPEP_0170480400 /NCGR_PEP_ID=MMETSP0208-20121228/1251_1 /TAXON_ID=197538 /ORGANISM="Strombidium inclinatum, Strain S3" /LENGTH=89 /DNA_ID=CAMNT_0010752941 /DNA_START=620 /DNA_END=889 /DNA_ORIENTATION=-
MDEILEAKRRSKQKQEAGSPESCSDETPAFINDLYQMKRKFLDEKSKIQDKIMHCLICIYNQQPMSEYFVDMVQVAQNLRHYNSCYIDS